MKSIKVVVFVITCIGIGLGILIGIGYYFFTQNGDPNEVTGVQDGSSAILPEALKQLGANSTKAALDATLETIDIVVETEDLSDIEKKYALLSKAYIQLVTRTEDVGQTPTETRALLKTIYDSSSDQRDFANRRINDYALFGFLYSFSEGCFVPGRIKHLPEHVVVKHFNFVPAQQNESAIPRISQKETFLGYISLLNDEAEFDIFKNDKRFKSQSAYIKAMYLDSYRDQISDEEKKRLVFEIENDINEFERGEYIMSTSPASTQIIITTPFQISFAKYVIEHVTTGVHNFTGLSDTYTKIGNLDVDPVFKSITQTFLKIYQLGAMYRANASPDEVRDTVSELSLIIKSNPDNQPLIRGYLNYGLSEAGKWFTLKNDFFKLTETSPELDSQLKSVGIKGY